MIYKVYFANAGIATTGLTPVFATYKKVSDGSDVTKPTITEIGAGWYKFTATPTEDIIGVIDGGATLTGADRFVPVDVTAQDPYLDEPISLVASLVESQRGAHTWQGNFFYVDPVNGDTHANGARGGKSDPYSLVQDCLDNAVTDSNHDVIFLISGASGGATTLTEDVIINKRYVFLRGPGRDFIWTRSGAGDTVSITADGVEISGVQIFTDSVGAGNGIDIAGADFVKIHKCWLNDTRGDAINISNSDNAQILNNHLQLSGQSGAGHGIVVDSAGGSSQYPIIQGNVIQHVAGDGIKLLGGNVEHSTIKDNVVQDCDGFGINIGAGVVEAFLVDNKLALNDSGDINDNGTDTSLHNNKTTEDAVWDELLTGSLHNIPSSAGKRLRNASSIVIIDGTCPSAPLQSNQIVLNGDASVNDGAYDPAMISIVLGTGIGQTRLILQYDGSTKTATVDRNWKIDPDDTSEYRIASHPGREHVNEGMARAGAASTITLNVLGSADDNAYNGQVIFLRSGTGEDQARKVTAYNGTTKVATVDRAWDVTPDNTTGYVMLPTGYFIGGVGSVIVVPLTAVTNATFQPGQTIEVVVGNKGLVATVALEGDWTSYSFRFSAKDEPDSSAFAIGPDDVAGSDVNIGVDADGNTITTVGLRFAEGDLDIEAAVYVAELTADTGDSSGADLISTIQFPLKVIEGLIG